MPTRFDEHIMSQSRNSGNGVLGGLCGTKGPGLAQAAQEVYISCNLQRQTR